MDATQVGRRLKELRIGAGKSQQELARASGVSLRTLQGIEQGESMPTFGKALALARALGVSLDALAEQPADSVPRVVRPGTGRPRAATRKEAG